MGTDYGGDRVSRFPQGAALSLDDLDGSDAHRLLASLRASEPVSWLPALGGWLVTSREAALDVMRDAGTFTVDDPRFSTAQVVEPSMLSPWAVPNMTATVPPSQSRSDEAPSEWVEVTA